MKRLVLVGWWLFGLGFILTSVVKGQARTELDIWVELPTTATIFENTYVHGASSTEVFSPREYRQIDELDPATYSIDLTRTPTTILSDEKYRAILAANSIRIESIEAELGYVRTKPIRKTYLVVEFVGDYGDDGYFFHVKPSIAIGRTVIIAGRKETWRYLNGVFTITEPSRSWSRVFCH